MNQNVTLLVHTHNNTRTIEQLCSTTNWVVRRIAIDMCSSDNTLNILRDNNFEIVSIPHEPWNDSIRNKFLSLPQTEWTLILDSDEYLSDDSEKLITSLIDQALPSITAYNIPRRNLIAGRHMIGSGWYPDFQTRLFRTNSVRFHKAHHKIPSLNDLNMETVTLEPPHCLHIYHNNYETLTGFLEKQLNYALSDIYSSDSLLFDFESYYLDATEEFIKHYDPQNDGDLSYALALAMYIDKLHRGLIHWEKVNFTAKLQHKLPNEVFYAMTRRELLCVCGSINKGSDIRHYYETSRSWRVTKPLRAIGSLLRRFARFIGIKSDF